MQACNILIGCDQKYYDDWGYTLLKSIRHYNPWIYLHCHIVNPYNINKIPHVSYTTEDKTFPNETVKIGYLQACRFLAVAKKFNNNELVMTIDADTICTRAFTKESFVHIAEKITVLRHFKDKRWLAGLVTYGLDDFKQEYAKRLNAVPFLDWAPFHDQNVLADLSKDYKFYEQPTKNHQYWMKYGKGGENSTFLTLKGAQKVKEKYLKNYQKIQDKILDRGNL